MAAMPNNKNYMLWLLIYYVQVEQKCDVGTLSNTLESGTTVFANSGVPVEAISSVWTLPKSTRESDKGWWLQPPLLHSKVSEHHQIVKQRLGLTEGIRCKVPYFMKAMMMAYKNKNFYNIKKARLKNNFPADGYVGLEPNFINKPQQLDTEPEEARTEDEDTVGSVSCKGSKGTGKSTPQAGIEGKGKSTPRSGQESKEDKAARHFACKSTCS